jgi:hypothetical protein
MDFLDNVTTCNTSLIDQKILFHRLKQAYTTLYTYDVSKATAFFQHHIIQHDVSKVTAYLLFREKSVVFETPYRIMWRMCFKTMEKFLSTIFDVILDLDSSFFCVWTDGRTENSSYFLRNSRN